ncbi:MAG TPA: ATP-binding protein [Methanocella sp.]|nr:ATP-binding protein [Methanocella sp.]
MGAIGVEANRLEQNGSRYYRVVVEDNGRGMPDEKKAVIFDRLKRDDTRARGTGLGLFIVKTIVEGFNGSVVVEGRVMADHTKGARFVVMRSAII